MATTLKWVQNKITRYIVRSSSWHICKCFFRLKTARFLSLECRNFQRQPDHNRRRPKIFDYAPNIFRSQSEDVFSQTYPRGQYFSLLNLEYFAGSSVLYMDFSFPALVRVYILFDSGSVKAVPAKIFSVRRQVFGRRLELARNPLA